MPTPSPLPTPPTVSIRLATVDDAQQIATVHVKTWQFAYRGQVPDEFLDSMSIEGRTRRWKTLLTTQEAQGVQEWTFVAEVDGVITGFCSVGKSRDEDADGTCGELYAIYVDSQSMNRGVGSALVKAGLKHLAAQDFATLTLWVLESNQRARRFYESKGWVADGVTRTEQITNAQIPEVRYMIRSNEI